MTHALIIADIEGIADIDDLTDIEKSSKLYTQEVIVYINALLANGINQITICDAHDEGKLLIRKKIEDINSGINKITLVSRIDGISFENKYDFAILVGFHGMEGSFGILPHTIRFDIKQISLVNTNNEISIPIGEVELYIRWLGYHNIPVIMVTGDREAVYEANCFNPYLQVCCVKSRLQKEFIDRAFLYDKLTQSVENALALNKTLCISCDNDKIAIELYNLDTTHALCIMGYNNKENRIIFNNCADLVKELYTFVGHLQDINKTTWETNIAFLKTVRELAKPLQKEVVANSEIGSLLNNNLLLLDRYSREKITSVIKVLLRNR